VVRIGGIASRASAIVTFQNSGVAGKNATNSAISATLGTARPTFEVEIARNAPRLAWPSQRPSGSATAIAIAIAAPVTFRWSHSSGRFSPPPTREPPAWDSSELKMNSSASPKSPRKASVWLIAPPAATA
jgi:hypothetical protein